MANAARRFVMVLGMAIGASAIQEPVKAESSLLRLSVLVINQTALPDSAVLRAETEAARIYEASGVILVWVDSNTVGAAFDLTMKIVSKALPAKEVDANALGVAAGTAAARGTTAYAFSCRIDDFAVRHNVDASVILGHVMAHELGHLLLPYRSHAEVGIMKGGWNDSQATRAARGTLAFSDGESKQIREALEKNWRKLAAQDRKLLRLTDH